MKSFLKKSVAIILFSTILCGFLSFGIAHAASLSPAAIQAGVPGSGTPNVVTQTQTTVQSNGSGDFSLWSLMTGGFSYLVQMLLQFVLSLCAIILALIANIFDFTINFSINTINQIFSSSTVTSIWTLVRDTLNIFFIFMLVFIAIQKIIGSWGSKAKTTLGNIIISALFINFSMFVAKFIIDVGNIFAVVLYNKIIANGNISDIFLAKSGITNFLKPGFFANFAATTGLQKIIGLLLQIVMVLVACWFFIWGAIMFVGRGAMLIYYVIISPIAFVGNTLPRLKKEADDWWEGFVNKILVAPVFLFFMLIVTSFLISPEFQKITDPLIKNNNGIDGMATYFAYLLIMMLMIKGLDETKKLSGKVAGVVMGIAKTGAAAATLAVTGGAAAAAGGLGSLGGAIAGGETAGIRGFAGRVSSTLKTFSATASKTATGAISGAAEKQTGFGGIAGRSLREQLVGGVKTVTGGTVDIEALRKSGQKYEKAEEKRRQEQILGPEKKAQQEIDVARQREVAQERLDKIRDTEKAAQEKTEEQEKVKRADIESDIKDKTQARDAAKTSGASETDIQKAEQALTESMSKLNKFIEAQKRNLKLIEAEKARLEEATRIETKGGFETAETAIKYGVLSTKKKSDIAYKFRKGVKPEKGVGDIIKDLQKAATEQGLVEPEKKAGEEKKESGESKSKDIGDKK